MSLKSYDISRHVLGYLSNGQSRKFMMRLTFTVPGPVDCDVMRSFGAENLPEILRWALHADLSHWRVVRNVIHCPWPEALEATLVVDRVAEHLCVVDHRSYDAVICRFGERVRPGVGPLQPFVMRPLTESPRPHVPKSTETASARGPWRSSS